MNSFLMEKIVKENHETYYLVKFEKINKLLWFSRWNAENWGSQFSDSEFKFYEMLRYIDLNKLKEEIEKDNFTEFKIFQLRSKYKDIPQTELHYMSIWEYVTLIKGKKIAKEYKNVTIQDDEYTFFFESYSDDVEIKTKNKLDKIIEYVEKFNKEYFKGEFEIYIGDSILEGIYYK